MSVNGFTRIIKSVVNNKTYYDILKDYVGSFRFYSDNIKVVFAIFDFIQDRIKFEFKTISFRNKVVEVHFKEHKNLKCPAPKFIRRIKVNDNLLILNFEYETSLFPPINDDILIDILETKYYN